MSEKPSWFDCLFAGEVAVSLINEPIVDQPKSALERARLRWLCEAALINGERHD